MIYEMNTDPSAPQPTNTPQQTPALPGQLSPQPGHSEFPVVTQHPQRSHFQARPSPAYDPQGPQHLVPQSMVPTLPEQSAFYPINDYGSQWQGRQHQHHVLPSVAVEPGYNPYCPTAGYPQHHVPQPVVSSQPPLAYYPHQQQQQQQQRLYHTPSQHRMQMPTRRQRLNSPNLNRGVQHRAPPPPQSPFQPLMPLARNSGSYPRSSQGSSCEDGNRWLNNVQPSVDKGGGVHAPGSGRNFGGAAKAEGHNTIPTFAELATVPIATQFQGAQNVNVSGNPTLTNIGTNTGNLTTVNNYGGTHGLENLKEFVSFAALHDSAEQDPDCRCHPGTRENVLMRLRDWFDNLNPTDRIFWLHGPAGAGKSAIAQTIADEYKERGLAATFFFYRSDPSRNDGKRLFPTIAWQLAFSIPPTKAFIVDALNKPPHIPTKAVEPQFEQLVAHPFQPINNIASQMAQSAPVVIIDGVDECSDEKLQQRFLAIIGNTVKNHCVPLQFLIVSRPEALIEETLNKFKDFTVSIDLAILDDSNRDIHKYLKDKFSGIASSRGLDPTWPGQETIKEVVLKSSGNFIFASLVIRFISDEDYEPEFLLNIVRNLTPRRNMSPFALLDQLFLEILKQQRDQDFLRNVLALLVGRSSIKQADLHKDDALLMDVSEKDLYTRLRRMRSLLKSKPFIDVYHKSFLDFLQDSSRSGQYHVKQGGVKQYLGLIVDSVVRHVSMTIEQPNRHETCRFSAEFKWIVKGSPPKIVLPVEDWQEALKPLLDLQDRLLNISKSKPCRITQVMRDLLLHLVLLQGKSYRIAAIHMSGSSTNETVTESSPVPVTETTQIIPETDLDNSLSALLSCLPKTNPITVDGAIVDRMFSLLAFDHAEIAARVRSISDAQRLIDIIDLLNNNECFLSRCHPDTTRKAAHLASTIFARVPLLPLSPFLVRPARHFVYLGTTVEFICQNVFISKILDHDYILPVLGIHEGGIQLRGSFGNVNEQTALIFEWLNKSSPNFATRFRVMVEIARTIRYIHSMHVVLFSKFMQLEHFALDPNLRAKFLFRGLFAWWTREASIYGYEDTDLLTECTYEANISAFANLFDMVCFRGHTENTPNHLAQDAKQLIEQCRAKDPKKRPTMEDIVKEMETWTLT